MTEELDLRPIDLLVLTRLLATGEKGDTVSGIRKDLAPLLEHRWSGNVLTQVLDRTLIRLSSLGLVIQRPGKTKRAAPGVLLTEDGRREALAALNVSALPAKPKPTWSVLKKSLLVARALGLSAPGPAFAKGTGLKAVLLRQKFGLPLGDYPDLKIVKTELTRTLLGMGPKEKITLDTVQGALFGRELGERRPADPKKVLDRLVSRHLGARRDDDREWREAVLRGWIDGSADGPAAQDSATPSTPRTEPSHAARAMDLAAFARSTRAAAEKCPTGRFGDDKVFIIHVWNTLQSHDEFRGTDLAGFKQRLAEANNARLLDLSRADLVQAMDPEDVRRSEVTYDNATFHFIRLGSERH